VRKFSSLSLRHGRPFQQLLGSCNTTSTHSHIAVHRPLPQISYDNLVLHVVITKQMLFAGMEMEVWFIGNALISIVEVTLRRARLVLGWVGWPSSGVQIISMTSHPGQLSLAIPPWVGTMSSSESRCVNRHITRYASPVSVVSQHNMVSGWGLW